MNNEIKKNEFQALYDEYLMRLADSGAMREMLCDAQSMGYRDAFALVVSNLHSQASQFANDTMNGMQQGG